MSDPANFDLRGPWADAARTIVLSMTRGVDPRDLELPLGPFSEVGAERYAREYVAAAGNASLGVVYAVAMVGVCTATQGAWVTLCPLHRAGWLEIPTIQYAMAVADSGVGKSTILDAALRPLRRVLAAGVSRRTERLVALRSQAERRTRERLGEEVGLGVRFDPKQFAAVYNSGICPVTLLKNPTMEALEQTLVTNGGHGTVASAEAEIFRAMSAYNPDGGSLSLLLDQWSQEHVSTARVGRGLVEMDNVSLNLMVLFQSDVFADVTGGINGRAGGGDSFISRGVFGRAWVVRAAHLGGYERLAAFYADDADEEHVGTDGYTLATGERTPLGAALHDYEANLNSLVEESDDYRAAKALQRAWRLGLIEHGPDHQVGQPPLPVRRELHLGMPAAREAYRRVQRLRLYVESELHDDRVDEDVRAVFLPLATRITQHVMREAAVISLGAGHRTVGAKAITDAATRLIPWRIAQTADALLTRQAEITTSLITEAARSNPTNADLSIAGIVAGHLAQLATLNLSERADGFTRSQIANRVRPGLRRQRGTGSGIGKIVGAALDELVADKSSGIQRVPGKPGAAGQEVWRYTIADAAISRWTR